VASQIASLYWSAISQEAQTQVAFAKGVGQLTDLSKQWFEPHTLVISWRRLTEMTQGILPNYPWNWKPLELLKNKIQGQASKHIPSLPRLRFKFRLPNNLCGTDTSTFGSDSPVLTNSVRKDNVVVINYKIFDVSSNHLKNHPEIFNQTWSTGMES
jgi:hypothetical protein